MVQLVDFYLLNQLFNFPLFIVNIVFWCTASCEIHNFIYFFNDLYINVSSIFKFRIFLSVILLSSFMFSCTMYIFFFLFRKVCHLCYLFNIIYINLSRSIVSQNVRYFFINFQLPSIWVIIYNCCYHLSTLCMRQNTSIPRQNGMLI